MYVLTSRSFFGKYEIGKNGAKQKCEDTQEEGKFYVMTILVFKCKSESQTAVCFFLFFFCTFKDEKVIVGLSLDNKPKTKQQ